jgi:hypothetical protein
MRLTYVPAFEQRDDEALEDLARRFADPGGEDVLAQARRYCDPALTSEGLSLALGDLAEALRHRGGLSAEMPWGPAQEAARKRVTREAGELMAGIRGTS